MSSCGIRDAAQDRFNILSLAVGLVGGAQRTVQRPGVAFGCTLSARIVSLGRSILSLGRSSVG